MVTQSPQSDSTALTEAVASADALAPLRILIVEDDLDMANLMRHVLENDGYQVIELNSGGEALALISAVERGEDLPFGVALLDIMMPEITGYDVCREIRRTERLGYIPIIIVTALSSMEDLVRGLDMGADDYLVKPFDYRELVARVRAAVRVRDVDRAMRRRNWQLAVLNSLSDAIGGSLDRNDVLQQALGRLLRWLDLDYAVAFLSEQHAEELTRVFHHDGEQWREARIRGSDGVAEDEDAAMWQERDAYREALNVMATGQRRWETGARGWPTPLEAPDSREDWRVFVPLRAKSPVSAGQTHVEHLDPESSDADLIVPSREVVGVLLVGAPTDKPMIDLDLLTALGNHIGQTLEKCYFYQQARNRSEELVALFDSISDLIYVVDDKYRIAAPNAALIKWLTDRRRGSTLDERLVLEPVAGQICYQILFGRRTACEACRMVQALQTGEHLQWTEMRRRPDGVREEWDISAYPIQGRQGGPSQAIILSRDVTERRMLEASLSQSEKLAALGQLAAGLAHEINNPLTAIVANVQLLLKNTASDGLNYESLALIKQASDRAVRVVRNLLDFARQEQYEFQPTDLNASLQAALELVRHQFLIAKVDVVTDLASDLPLALVSQDHLQGVWLNLLLNARDAVTQRMMAEHESSIWVCSRLRDDGFLEVSFRDNGVGIAPDQLNRVFDPFFTTKDPGKGTGLGLSTSYHVVKQHGGEIQVDSELGVGTTFTVLLPAMDH